MHGHPVAGPQEKIDATAHQYDEKIAAKDRERTQTAQEQQTCLKAIQTAQTAI